MGKNIALLYMSAYFAQPAPEGSKNRFLRTQTNEAAVSALANGNALFRVATLTEAQEYLTAAVEQGELLLDLTRKDTVAQGIVYYQSVQQYRNQINHATDSAVKFQKDTGLLPLSTSAIEQTLGDVAFYLFKLKECKATAPVGIELLDSNKAF